MHCCILFSLVVSVIGESASNGVGLLMDDKDLYQRMLKLEATVLQLQSKERVRSKRLVLDDEDLYQRVQKLEATVVQLQSKGIGSTYTRWGRTDCPSNGTELVYKGYVGGSHETHGGGGVNYLCLPETPIYDHVVDGVQSGSYIFGAEYQFGGNTFMKGFIKKSLLDDNVPCAVCSTSRPKNIMIPGRNRCYDGWSLEYKGYLVSGYVGHAAASEFVCLDDDPVPIVGGHANNDGKLLYFVESICGSLECPPYVNGHELTCAVCSK